MVIGRFNTSIRPLIRTATRLARRNSARKPLPALWFVTDPQRTPDPVVVVARLPRGAGVIYRAFGAEGAVEAGLALRRVTRRAGVLLLVGADPVLAQRVGADGVHLPERLAHLAPRLRRVRPQWRITAAAHGEAAVRRAARFGAEAALVSAVFPSRSPSAGPALGVVRFEAIARRAAAPVIALGGINGRTAQRLSGSRAVGIAAVEAFEG